MFETKYSSFSDFFLDKIDFNLDKIDVASSLLWNLVGHNPSRRGVSKRITQCDSLTSTYDHSRNIDSSVVFNKTYHTSNLICFL